jgi:hypothetical protein
VRFTHARIGKSDDSGPGTTIVRTLAARTLVALDLDGKGVDAP